MLLPFFILVVVYFAYQPELQIFHFSLNNPFYQYVEPLPWWLYIAISFSVFSIIAVLVLLTASIYFTTVRDRKEKRKKDYEDLYSEVLTNHFFKGQNNNKDSFPDIPKPKTQLELIIFFSVFLKIQNTVSYDLSPDFLNIFEKMELHWSLKKLLYSHKHEKNILALKIISHLKINRYNKTLKRYTRNTNIANRIEAITSLIKLSESFNINIINQLKKPSLLEINGIYDTLTENQIKDVDYDLLFDSQDENKILLAIMLINNRKLAEYKDRVKQMLGHAYENLNLELWSAYLSLEENTEEYINTVIYFFHSQSEKAKLLILSKDIEASCNKYYSFLELIINNENSLNVRTKAMKVLLNKHMHMIPVFKESKDEKTAKAFKEVIDLNI